MSDLPLTSLPFGSKLFYFLTEIRGEGFSHYHLHIASLRCEMSGNKQQHKAWSLKLDTGPKLNTFSPSLSQGQNVAFSSPNRFRCFAYTFALLCQLVFLKYVLDFCMGLRDERRKALKGSKRRSLPTWCRCLGLIALLSRWSGLFIAPLNMYDIIDARLHLRCHVMSPKKSPLHL